MVAVVICLQYFDTVSLASGILFLFNVGDLFGATDLPVSTWKMI